MVMLFDKNDHLTDFYNLTCIKIYKKLDGKFIVIKEISRISADTSSIQSFREFLSKLLDEFKESKIIVGSQITGIPFHFFTQQGFEICEAEVFSDELQQQIYEDFIEHPKSETEVMKNELNKTEAINTPIKPFAIDDEGNYFLDFVRIQRYRPEITSKKAILPFLSNELFQTLTIICNHVMTWLENYFSQNDHLEYSFKKEDGIYKVIISRKV